MNMETIVLVVARLLAAIIFAAGAVWLASESKEGWGWCVFASIFLGAITIERK
jgi:hypothetical protein